jgi:hypothetical protein
MKLVHLRILILFAVSVFAQTPADQRETTEAKNKRKPNRPTKNGDVTYVSHAKVKVSNLVKDVCGYIQAALKCSVFRFQQS